MFTNTWEYHGLSNGATALKSYMVELYSVAQSDTNIHNDMDHSTFMKW
jgi:hypothetical protein